MKKDKEWLKREIYAEYNDSNFIKVAWDLIDQLEEPEKVVIPKFVADYIELNKGWSEDRQEYTEDDSSGLWFALDGNSYGMPNSVSDWLFNEEKVETFAKAWLDGYEVEKEKLYRIKFSDNQYASRFNNRKINSILTDEELAAQYTEAEIKAIDKRYWAFAEEVTE